VTPLAVALAAFVDGYRQQQVPLADLWAHAVDVEPEFALASRNRVLLADAIAELVAAGVVVSPKDPKAWDVRREPALPAWVKRPPPVPRAAVPARVWPAVLEPAAALARNSRDLEMLERIARWLRDAAEAFPVPLEERSLEIFGDEKRLASLRSHRFFTTGAITLGLLACHPTPLPLASQHVTGTGPTSLLVAENNATFFSFLTVARSLPPRGRPDLHVAWGMGKQFPVSVEGVRLLDPPPEHLRYFGDLDRAGLQVAVAAAAAAERLELPPLRPAEALYREMLPVTAGADRSNAGAGEVGPLVAWFADPELRSFAAGLLRRRKRVAQESVGLAVLRGRPELIRAAVG
jgi:hypothetical protein